MIAKAAEIIQKIFGDRLYGPGTPQSRRYCWGMTLFECWLNCYWLSLIMFFCLPFQKNNPIACARAAKNMWLLEGVRGGGGRGCVRVKIPLLMLKVKNSCVQAFLPFICWANLGFFPAMKKRASFSLYYLILILIRSELWSNTYQILIMKLSWKRGIIVD